MSQHGRRVALVTGAGQGIGRAIAERLAQDGIALMLTQLDDEPLQETAATLRERGGEIVAEAADLTCPDQVAGVARRAFEALGQVDILVNNAGFNRRKGHFVDIDLGSWNEVISGNLTAAFLLARLVAPGMIDRGWGRIVNVGANQSMVPLPGNAAYAAAKAGLIGLTRSLAVDLSAAGVVVNGVAPGGPVLTRELDAAALDSVQWPTLVGRPGETREVAELVAFLVSDRCTFTVGETILCDGGRLLSRLPDVGHGSALGTKARLEHAG